MGFDSTPIRVEKSLYELAALSHEYQDLAEELEGMPSDRVLNLLRTKEPPTGVDEEVWHEWRYHFQSHLYRYGHAVYNLNSVKSVYVDAPAPLFDMLEFYLRG